MGTLTHSHILLTEGRDASILYIYIYRFACVTRKVGDFSCLRLRVAKSIFSRMQLFVAKSVNSRECVSKVAFAFFENASLNLQLFFANFTIIYPKSTVFFYIPSYSIFRFPHIFGHCFYSNLATKPTSLKCHFK